MILCAFGHISCKLIVGIAAMCNSAALLQAMQNLNMICWAPLPCIQRQDLKSKPLIAAIGHVGLPHRVICAPDVVPQAECHALGHVRLVIHYWKGRSLPRAHKCCIQCSAAHNSLLSSMLCSVLAYYCGWNTCR